MHSFVRIHVADQSNLSIEEKELRLLAQLAEFPSVIVALSGGADSAYLAWAANRAVGNRALSVTALSPTRRTP